MRDLRAESTAADSAAREAVAAHTVGIIATDDAGNTRAALGTGSAIKWGDHHVILTARHVLANTTPTELRFFVKPEGNMITTSVDDLPTAQQLRTSKIIKVENVKLSSGHGLAALAVSAEIGTEYPINFFPLQANAITPPVGTILGALGYPTSLSREVMKGSRAAFPTMTYEKVVTTNALLQEFDPQHHFLTTYTFAKDSGDQPHPGGYSGTGMWAHVPPTGIWQANLQLAGVVIAYYAGKQLLKAIRVETVITFLTE